MKIEGGKTKKLVVATNEDKLKDHPKLSNDNCGNNERVSLIELKSNENVYCE